MMKKFIVIKYRFKENYEPWFDNSAKKRVWCEIGNESQFLWKCRLRYCNYCERELYEEPIDTTVFNGGVFEEDCKIWK